MPKITINVTKHQILSMWEIYRRAEDDWQNYSESAGVENDFPKGEWGPYRRAVQRDMDRAFAAMQNINEALTNKRNAKKPKDPTA